MEILKIIGIAILTSIMAVIVKQIKPEFYIVILLSGGIVILLMVIDQFKVIIDYFITIFSKTNLDISIFTSVLKVLGVGYLTEFANSICVDSGNSSLGDKVLLGGKIIILCMALPIITSLLDIIISLL